MPLLDPDVDRAAAARAPVLISADPAVSQAIACELDRRSGRPTGAVLVVDCTSERPLGVLESLAGARETERGQLPGILLLQEVHALGSGEQEALARHLEALLLEGRPGAAVRLVTSSSVPLFERVEARSFEERLYYRLNMIHIVARAEAA